MTRSFLAVVMLSAPLGCHSSVPPLPEPPRDFITLAPGLRVDRAARVIEFDGTVPIDAHNDETPDVYLELLVTGPDSREHEALVVTSVPPSLIHAAMLAIALQPGEPGQVTWDGATAVRVSATGDVVTVHVKALAGETWTAPVPLASWAIDAERTTHLNDFPGWNGLVFAGSRADAARGVPYVADRTGTIIGLTTFATEVISPKLTLSHEASIDAPAWLADRARTPVRGTPVRVIIAPAE